MCEIVGIVGQQDPYWLTAMYEVSKHRGPDDYGEYRDTKAGVSLGMRRLSIIDLDGGHQPMSNEDGSVWIVHNGEIYNAQEIRPRLLASGHRFRSSHSDTEVLIHLYEDEQEAMLDDLNGMFAFVIYDRLRKILFGARDRLGIKPLYYTQHPGLFAFASELKSFLTLPFFNREMDMSSFYHYMSLLYVPGESSIFKGVKRLPSAHWFIYDLSTRVLAVHPYWDLDFQQTEDRSEEEWCEQIRTGLGKAVKRWMVSDVPVGCSLSGGTDSPAIVGLLAENGYPNIKTYSLGFAGKQEQEFNELPLARQVAARWGTDHHELIIEPEDILRDLVRMVWFLDEPYGGGLPSWYIYEFMSREVTVGIVGTGGDELFGNYGKFRCYESGGSAQVGMTIRQLVDMGGNSARALSRLAAFIASVAPSRLVGARVRRHLLRFSDIVGNPLMYNYFHTWYYLSDETKQQLIYTGNHHGPISTANLLQQVYETSNANNIRDAIAYLDIKTQLADEFLLVTDRFSMAHSLEARVPFLDHTFVELMFQIPAPIRIRRNDPKYLLKKAVRDLLPPELLTARKRGFIIPISLWLRNSLRPLTERLLAPERLRRQGVIRPEFYDRFVRPHLECKTDCTWQIWAALMFQLWHLVFIEEKSTSIPSFSCQDLC
ncbi:asparagine synthase (glutamine-hydrolyzing) [Desulfobacterota bacterium AH_259_B03_O07]|nr:asparagine synthase (glutamine-hydrolyzing) [Desulfobacterota bacterium AH_259_B03_O07]